jgi:pimeloyl-ACP methyl ester carboxylesterase
MRAWLITRRVLLLAALGALAACANAPGPEALPPIVFVHGNGDNAGNWTTTLWRFESNGWPRERLHAIDLAYPLARDDDTVPQPGRSSAAEQMAALRAEVEAVLARTGARQVVLFGNSRGGNVIRNYIAHGGGAAKVSHAILGGAPNHGVYVDAARRPGSEFNGAGPFLTALNNQGAPGVETTPGPRWMTIRSLDNDKFAQAEGTWIGSPGQPTNVSAAGPELRGAENVVIPVIDHRETSYSAPAFAAAYRFITGREPATTGVQAEARIVLDGRVSGFGVNNQPAAGGSPSNLPLVGATVEVFATDAATGERVGPSRWRTSIAADGRWGPFEAAPGTAYEFVIAAPGHVTTHIYRQPFPRSSAVVHLRAERLLNDADRAAGAVVMFVRPRGYFGLPRDTVVFDGQNPAPGIPRGVAGVASSRIRIAGAPRTVAAQFNQQHIVGRTWPAAEQHLVQLELHD